MKRLDFLKATHIFVLGFGEFDPLTIQQANILSLLDQYAAELSVTLMMPFLPEDPAIGPEDNIYFANAWTSWERLNAAVTTAKENGNTEQKIQAIALPRTNSRLAYALRSKPWPEERKEEKIQYRFACFPDLMEEIRYVLGDLRAKKVANDWHYRDFAIAVTDPSWLPSLRRLTKEFDIPVYFDQAVALRESLPVGLLNLVFNLIEECDRYGDSYGFKLELVTRYLRHPLLDIAPEKIDRFENFCLQRGIDGYRFEQKWRYLKDWTSEFREGIEGELSPYYQFQQTYLKPVREFQQRVSKDKSRLKRIQALKIYLEEIGLEDRIAELNQTLPQSEAIELVKSWNNLLQWMEGLALWTGDTCESLDAFEAFMVGLEAGEMETIPYGTDQVLIADSKTCAQGHLKPHVIGATISLFQNQTWNFPI